MSRRKRDDGTGFEEWGGYMEAKKSKLEEQFCLDAAKQADTNNTDRIFQDISIFVNGYTIPSADELKLLMIKYGGIYHHYYRSDKTTHVIASNLPDSKIKQIKGIKFVKPEWIVDSVAKNKLLDYRPYLLYTQLAKTQPKLFVNTYHLPSSSANITSGVSDSEQQGIQCLSILSPINDQFTHSIESNANGKEILKNKTYSKEVQSIKKDNMKNNITKTASEATFLSEFYSNSRLHHISTMGVMFKQYISNLRAKSVGEFDGVSYFKQWLSKQTSDIHTENVNDDNLIGNEKIKYKNMIMHIDMDCFFVSVGLRKRSDLKDFPVAVTHAKSSSQNVARDGMDRQAEFNLYRERAKAKLNISDEDCNTIDIKPWSARIETISEFDSMSEIASCNYAARKAGVKNGMFVGQALKLCPNLKTIPYDFEAYKEVSFILYNTIARHTLDIEAVSCDEMFVDCSELLNATSANPLQFASYLRQEIKDKTGCACSTGFGLNRLQARLATKRAKPDGQFYLTPDVVLQFMESVKVADLPGVGRATSYKLSQLGIETCADLQNLSLKKLQIEFGKKTGDTLFKNCRGQDDRSLVFGQVRKSVSAEVNYGIRFGNQIEADNFMKQLAEEVHTRLQEAGMAARCITLKLMVKAKDAPKESAKFLGHGVCDYTTKSCTLSTATSDRNIILREVLTLCKQLNVSPRDLRGIGIQLSRLDTVSRVTRTLKDSIDKFLVTKNKQNSAITEDTNKIKKSTYTSVDKAEANKPETNRTNSRTINTTKSIDQYYKSKKLKESDIECKVKVESLDKEVLSALPEDIRQEVLQHYGLNVNANCDIAVKTCETNKEQSPRSQILESPNDNQNPLLENQVKLIHKQEMLSDEKDYTHLMDNQANSDSPDAYNTTFDISLPELRTVIREWVKSEENPQDSDIDLISNYCQQLIKSRKLENLDITLRCLHRCIAANGKSTEWQKTYFNIIERVQEIMFTFYGAKLLIENSF